MNENNFGGLDDIDYSAKPSENNGPTGVSAPVLDDIDYVPPSAKKGGPTGVSAPVLDDMDAYVPPVKEKKGAPTGVSAPVLDDESTVYEAEKEEKLIMTDEEIIQRFSAEQLETYNRLPEANKQKVLELMRKQLGAEAPKEEVKAPVLDDDNYIPPEPEKKAEPQPQQPVTAPILDDAPETPVYKPKFVDEDLERAKKEAAKKAVSSQLVSEQKDSKESLRMMLELKEERRREDAKKGFKVVIVLALLGIVAAVAFYLLYSGSLGLTYDESGLSKFADIIKNSSMYIAIAMGVSSLTLVTGVGFFKSLTTLIHLLSAIVQVFPGFVMISQHNGSTGLAIALYAVSIICTISVFVGLSAIESVGRFYNKNLR